MNPLGHAFKSLPFQSFQPIRGIAIALTLGWSAIPLGTIAQATTQVQCQDWQNNLLREWIERSRSYSQSQNLEAAAQALLQVVQVMGPAPTSQLRMETLRSLFEETPTGILQTFVEQAIQQNQPQTALTVLPVWLEMAQGLPTAYSAVKTQALTTIATHYLALGDAAQARQILDQAITASTFLQGAEFQTKALTAIAQGYRDLGDTAQAETLLGQSLQFARQMNHPQPVRHAWVLEPIALTYAELGNADQALAVVQELRDYDPSLQSYGNQTIATVVRRDAQAQQWDLALARLSEVNDSTIKASLLAELAGQRSKVGQVQPAQILLQQAIETAKQETSEGLQNNALIQVLRTYGETTGRVSEVLPWVKTLRDPAAQATLYNALAALEPQAEQRMALLDQGVAAARQIEDSYQRSSLIGSFLAQHFAAQRWTIALALIQSLPEDDPFSNKNEWFNTLAKAAAQAGDWAASLAVLEQLPEQWDDYRNSGFQTIALGSARAGNFAAALNLLPRITNNGSHPYRIRTLVALAEQARLQGDTPQSQGLLRQAEAMTQQLDFEPHQADALTTLAIALNKAGQQTQAQQFQAQALQLLQRDPSMMGHYLQNMITQYLDAQDYNGAVQVAIAVPNIQEEQSWILNNLAEKLIEANALDTALAATNRIQKPEDKARFLVTLAAYHLTEGNFRAVTTTLDQALTTAQTIADPESRQLVFRTPPDQTIVEDPYDRASLLETIALNYANIGQLEKAMTVVQHLKDPTLRQGVMQQLSCYRQANS
ncbi:MAG: tetratricopeptide repeat protein [Prochlorotrichaceae cyanobacterium]